jgi:putative ABC transport system permease protein
MNYALLVSKNLGRRKLRTSLSLIAIFIAFFLFGCLASMNHAFHTSENVASDNRMVTVNKINFTFTMPIYYVDRVKQVPGVAAVSHASWFGGYFREPKEQLISFAVDPESYFAVYPELIMPPEQRKAYVADRIGLAVGKAVAAKYGWKVGSTIPVASNIFAKSDGTHVWDFKVDAIFASNKDPQRDNLVLLHYDYFNDTITFARDTVHQILFTTVSARENDAIAKAIDSQFVNSPAETTTETAAAFNKAFAAQFGNIALIITLVVGAAFAAILLIVGNTMMMAIRERTREIGVLKALGFSSHSILWQVLAESLLLASVGGILGLAAASLVMAGAKASLASFVPGLHMPGSVFAMGLALVLLLGFATGIIPALTGMRLNTVTALGRR